MAGAGGQSTHRSSCRHLDEGLVCPEPAHLIVSEPSHESGENHVGDGIDVGGATLASDRRHLHAIDATRRDPGEAMEIGRHVERESMPAHPAPDRNPDGGNLPPSGDPYAWQRTHSITRNTKCLYRIDDHLLELADIPPHVLTMSSEVQDGIPHELSGAVVRHLPSPARSDDRDDSVVPIVRTSRGGQVT